MFKKIIKIFFVIICMVSIFILSSDTGSNSDKKSDTVIVNFYKLFHHGTLSSNKKKTIINKYVVYVRKSAHFILYFFLGLSLISLIKEYRLLNVKSLIIALIIASLYACSDEFHQYFVSGRSCELLDVLIDIIGAFIGIIVYYFYKLRRKFI